MESINITDKEEIQSKVIDFLRFPLMIGVVIIHCRYTSRLQPQLLDDVINGGGYDYVSWLFSKVIFGVCVPIFFLISGYLFFKKGTFTPKSYASKLKKRFISIVIPFILWNFLYLLIYRFIGYRIIYNDTGEIMGIVPWITAVSGNMIKDAYQWFIGVFVNFNGSGSPMDVPFWYLRDLIVMFVISPIVYCYGKYLKHYGIILMVIAYIVLGKYIAFPSFLGLSLRPPVLFFVIGASYAVNQKNMIEEITKVGSWIYWVYGLIALTDLLTKDLEYNCYLHRLTILLGIVVVFKIAAAFVKRKDRPENKFLTEFKNTNFFIYAFHWILLYWLSQPLSILAGKGTDLILVIVYFLQILLCCSICIGLGLLLNKNIPKMMKVMNGR